MKPDRDGDKRGGDFVRQNETFLVKIGSDAANSQFHAHARARAGVTADVAARETP
jgi:hypothetical protein